MEDLELFKSFRFNLYNFIPGKHTDNSHGVESHFIGYMYRGNGRLISEKGTIEVGEGEMFYIPKGCRYQSYWYGKECALFDSFAFSAIPQQEHIGYCMQKLTITEPVRQLHQQLVADRTVNARSVGILYQLFSALAPTMKVHTYEKSELLARQIAEHIAANPQQRTDQVAKACGVSESTLYHLLKQKLEKTPNQLRQEAKCRQAVNLLTATDLSVEQISSQLGFSSSSYMRKLLHNITGKTPLQHRKSAHRM